MKRFESNSFIFTKQELKRKIPTKKDEIDIQYSDFKRKTHIEQDNYKFEQQSTYGRKKFILILAIVYGISVIYVSYQFFEENIGVMKNDFL